MKRSHCIGMMAATLLADRRQELSIAEAVGLAEGVLRLAELAELNRNPPPTDRPHSSYRTGGAV